MRTRSITLVLALSLLALCGCEVVDSQLRAKTRSYFPAAEIVKPRRDVLHIETHVGNISREFAREIMLKMLNEHGSSLSQGFQFAGYRWLILGFNEFNAVWDIANPRYFTVLDGQQFSMWVRSTFGRLDYPTAAPPGTMPQIPPLAPMHRPPIN